MMQQVKRVDRIEPSIVRRALGTRRCWGGEAISHMLEVHRGRVKRLVDEPAITLNFY